MNDDMPEMDLNGFEGVGPDETFIPTKFGQKMVFPSDAANSDGVSYVRFVSPEGKELLYYSSDEWADEPAFVMGAILGAWLNGIPSNL